MPLTPINRNPTRRTQIQNRRVGNPAQFMRPEIAGSGFGALAATFDSFAKKKSAEEEQLEVLEDEKALANLAMNVNSREAEAIQAVRSGDYSNFMDTNRAGRINILKNAPLVIGGALGTSRAVNFSAEINKLGPTESAAKRAQEYIKESTKGMDPRAALKFSEAFQKGIAPALKDRQEQLEKFAAERMQSQFMATLEGSLRTGAIASLDDLNTIIATTANSFGNNVENQLKLQELADEEVARMSAAGDPRVSARANALLTVEDPVRRSSIADRLGPAKLDSLRNEQSKAWYEYIGKQAHEVMDKAKLLIAQHKAGVPGAPNPGQILQWMTSSLDSLGAHGPKVNAATIAAYGAIASDAVDQSLLNGDPREGRTAGDIDKIYEATKKDILNPILIANIGFNGASPSLKSKFSTSLKTGDSDEFAKTRAAIQAAMSMEGKGLEEFVDDPAAMAIYLATENDDPQKALNTRALIVERVVAEGGLSNAFGNLTDLDIIGESDSNRGKIGLKGYATMGERIFDDTKAVTAAGLKGVTWENMDATLKGKRFQNLLDAATLASGGNPTEENIKKNFLRMVSNDIEMGSLGSDGKAKYSLRKTPKLVLDENGRPILSKAIKPQMAQAFVDELEEAGLKGKVGYRTDGATTMDGTVGILVDVGYGMQPVRLSGGKQVMVPEELMGLQVLGNQFIASDIAPVPGMVLLDVPMPSEADVEGKVFIPKVIGVSPVSELRWDPRNQTWELRRALGPNAKALQSRDTPTDAAAVAAMQVEGITGQSLENAQRTLEDLQNKALQAAEARAAARDQYVDLDEPSLDAAIDAAKAGGSATDLSDLRGLMLEKRRREAGEPTESEKLQNKPEEPKNLSSEAIKQMIDANDPRTMSMEQLRAALIERHKAGRKGNNQDIVQAMLERKAGKPPVTLASLLPDRRVPGSGLAVDNMSVPDRESHNRAMKDAMRKFVMDGVINKTYSFEAIAATRNAESLEQAKEIAESVTKRNGGYMDTSLEAAKMTPFMSDVVDFIMLNEDFRANPYKDPGAKGVQWNIGFGFSLHRGDSNDVLEAVDTSVEKVMAGEPITRKQAAIISSFAIARQEKFLREWLPGVKLAKHQKKALHSFIYSSQWEDGKPTVVGPNIQAAIKSGNHGLVATMIRNTTRVADPKANILKGMQNRRNREADMYLGRYLK